MADNHKCIMGISPKEFGEMVSDVKHTRSDVKYIREKLEPRVRNLENWRSYIIGMMVVVGGAVTLLAKFVF